ncbi:MAG: 23S rRNA (guanosine(2251)-2'-O)-methyltransferase RlmB [Sphaerochaetaceae bacterium]|nr:23S rRNA (guanosine(2251)-2'-O)-methyltransferase RlmB [Sphaerochaetaceae bacterium]
MADFIIGFHAIEEALKNTSERGVLYICRNMEKRNTRLESMGRTNPKITVKKIAKAEMDKMVPRTDHRGVLLQLKSSSSSPLKKNEMSVKEFLGNLKDDQSATVLILDGITDVNNLGAITRSADQFSVSLVIVPTRRSAQANSTVERISSGAASYVPTASVANIVREIEVLQSNGFWVYGADMDGEALHNVKFPHRTAIVMGSEGSGLSQLVEKRCDHIVSIPTEGHIDSLNVSVATGILLYERSRQLKVRS